MTLSNPVKEAKMLARDAVNDGFPEGNVDCPACGGAARLWYGVSNGELSVCCVVPDEECDFAYHWGKKQW